MPPTVPRTMPTTVPGWGPVLRPGYVSGIATMVWRRRMVDTARAARRIERLGAESEGCGIARDNCCKAGIIARDHWDGCEGSRIGAMM